MRVGNTHKFRMNGYDEFIRTNNPNAQTIKMAKDTKRHRRNNFTSFKKTYARESITAERYPLAKR